MAPGKESRLRVSWQSYSVKTDPPPPQGYASPARPAAPRFRGLGGLSPSPTRSGDGRGRAADPTLRRGGRPGRACPARPLPPPGLAPRRAGPEGPRRAGGLRLPVLASRDDPVLLGDEERGAHHVLVPLDLAEEDGPAALRPRVDLGRHVAAGPARRPSADGAGKARRRPP